MYWQAVEILREQKKLTMNLYYSVVSMKTAHVTHEQASQLLHNKFVVVLGDSSEYKTPKQ